MKDLPDEYVGEVTVEVRDGKGLPTLVDGLKELSMSDPSVIRTTEEYGEHFIDGCGKLHVGGFVKDLSDQYVGDVAVEVNDGKGLPTLLDRRLSSASFEAHLLQAALLKKVVVVLRDFCTDVNFECTEKGIQVQSMDSSHVALVSLLLRESAFSEFKCDRPTFLGINVELLSKILKRCSPQDSLKIRWSSGADTVSFQCEEGEGRIADFDLKLMQVESEHTEIPEQCYKIVARLPSSEFQRICRDLWEFGETMRIKASAEGITFSVQGDAGSGNVLLKPREAGKPEDKVTLTVHEPVTATFALRYLVNFSKAAPLCGSVELGLGPGAPLLVKYALEAADNGHMQFYLAPLVEAQCCLALRFS